MEIEGGCGANCSWMYSSDDEQLRCVAGGGYVQANFLEAEETKFHDESLIEATKIIKEAVAKANEKAGDRVLALVNTGEGVLLSWINHEDEVFQKSVQSFAGDDRYVTIESSPEKIRAALKLKTDSPAQSV